jgi:hypothetical protein
MEWRSLPVAPYTTITFCKVAGAMVFGDSCDLERGIPRARGIQVLGSAVF